MLNKLLIEYKKDNNFVKVKYDKKLLTLETPFLRVPFGIKENDYLYKKFYHYQISINTKFNPKSGDFLRIITFLEKDAKDKLFDIIKDKSFISRIYVPNENDPLVKLDIKKDTIFKDEDNNVILLNNYINKGFICSSIFKYTGVYIGENNWGLSFKVDEIKIKNPKMEYLISFK